VFENRLLRTIFGPKKDEVTGGWRKLHNEELRDLYTLLVGKPEEKKTTRKTKM
jgi:hypothetical protein